MSETSAVLDAARSHDRDRYLSALLAPTIAQDDLVVLAAYFGELKRIPLVARETEIGEVRFQWWRDTLASPGAASGHPVADGLMALAERRSLPRELLLAPLEGYARELYEDGVSRAGDVSLYAEETEGAAIRLALAVLGGPEAKAAELSVEPAGRALALTRLALTLPQHLSHGRLPLPESLVTEAGDPRPNGRPEASAVARKLSELLAAEVRRQLADFRASEGRLGANIFSAFLPLCLADPYLNAILKPGRDVLRDVADISPLSRVMRLWFAHWRGRA